MSIFDPTTDQSQTTDNNQTDPNATAEDYLKKVVELKGERWQDPNEVAKGYLNAQSYITELEEAKKQLESKVTQEDYAKELLTRLQDKANSTAATPDDVTNKGGNTEQVTDTKDAVSEEVLKGLVSDVLTERERTSTVSQNIAEVDTKMNEVFGTDAKNVLAARAQELNITPERMQELAGESPSAFMALMGQPNEKETNSTLKGTLNASTAQMMNRQERDSKYYFDLMKNQPKVWSRPETQNQMREDKKRLGAKFFN